MGRVSPAMRAIEELSSDTVGTILSEKRYWTPACFRHFLTVCGRRIQENPCRGLTFAKVGPQYAERLRTWTSEARPLAAATLGAAYRATGELATARKCFERVNLRDCSSLSKAFVYLRWADLLIDCGETNAFVIADKAISLFGEHKPGSDDLASALIIRGIAARVLRGDALEAQVYYRRAIPSINPRNSPHIFYAAVHNMGCALLVAASDPREIFRAVKRAEFLLRRFRIGRKSKSHAKLRWLKAIANRLVGATELAKSLLKTARRDLFEISAYRDYAQVTLELAYLYYSEGRLTLLTNLVEELVEAPLSIDLQAVILAFQKQLKGETLNEATFRWLYSKVYGIKAVSTKQREMGIA